MFLIYVIFAFSSFWEKVNMFLIPCPFKYLTGYDCPGCGFQRALIALIKGDFQESFQLYPPTIPLLLTFMIGLSANYWWAERSKVLINALVIITGSIVIISYMFKLFVPHSH